MIKTNSASIQNKSIDSVGDCKDNTKAFAFLVPEDSEIINSRAVEAAQCTNSKKYCARTYFHDCIDNSDYEDIDKDNTIERLIMKSKSGKSSIPSLIERFKCKLKLTEALTEYYENLIKSANSQSIQNQRMIINIISGTSFREEKTTMFPYIEITQNINTLPENEKTGILGNEEHKSAYLFDNIVYEQTYNVEECNIVYCTPYHIEPNFKGIYNFNKTFLLFFDENKIDKEKYFTVNLYKTNRSNTKNKRFGKPSTFYLTNFKDQKVKEISLDFRDSFQSQSEGRVKFRFQYIHDEEALYRNILK